MSATIHQECASDLLDSDLIAIRPSSTSTPVTPPPAAPAAVNTVSSLAPLSDGESGGVSIQQTDSAAENTFKADGLSDDSVSSATVGTATVDSANVCNSHDVSSEENVPNGHQLPNASFANGHNNTDIIPNGIINKNGDLIDAVNGALKTEPGRHFCSQWPSIITEGLASLWRQQSLCDVVLETDDGVTVAAHRAVLCAASGHFIQLLKANEAASASTKGSQLPKYPVNDITTDVLTEVLSFIYTGRINVHQANQKDLINAADTFQIPALKNTCVDITSDHSDDLVKASHSKESLVPVKRKRGRPRGSKKHTASKKTHCKPVERKHSLGLPTTKHSKDEEKDGNEHETGNSCVKRRKRRCRTDAVYDVKTEDGDDYTTWGYAELSVPYSINHFSGDDKSQDREDVQNSLEEEHKPSLHPDQPSQGRKRRQKTNKLKVKRVKQEKGQDSGDSPAPCHVCGKVLRRRSRMDEHMRLHTGERPYKCGDCDKTFVSQSSLKTHEYVHKEGAKLSCEECNITFTSKHSYTYHMRFKHIRGRDLMCQHCGRCYRYPESLKFHENSCQGRKPYKCPKCSKGFAIKSMIYKHMATHSDEFSFQCSECGKRFSRQDNLNVHMRIHSGEKPYSCETCGMAFRVKCSLRSHEKCVHGIKTEVSKPRDEPLIRRRNPTNSVSAQNTIKKAVSTSVTPSQPAVLTTFDSQKQTVSDDSSKVADITTLVNVSDNVLPQATYTDYRPPNETLLVTQDYTSITSAPNPAPQNQLPAEQYLYTPGSIYHVPRPYNQYYN